MVCENCKEGICFNLSCFHCSEDWKERFFKDIQKQKFRRQEVIKYLGYIEEEVKENYEE